MCQVATIMTMESSIVISKMQYNLTSNIVKLLMIEQSMIQDKIEMKVEYIDHNLHQ